MTRLICLDCSAGRYINPLDICSKCVDKSFTVTRDNGTVKLNHLPTHLLLQLRRPLPLLLQLFAREFAQELAQLTVENVPTNTNAEDSDAEASDAEASDAQASDAQASEGVCCKDCGNHVQQPFWACCNCSGESLN